MKSKFLAIAVLGLLVMSGIGMIFSAAPAHGATGGTGGVSWWNGIKGASLRSEYLGHTGTIKIEGNTIIQLSSNYVYYYNLTTGALVNSVEYTTGSGGTSLFYDNGYVYVFWTYSKGLWAISPTYVVTEQTLGNYAVLSGDLLIVPHVTAADQQLGIDYSNSSYWGAYISQNITVFGELDGFSIRNMTDGEVVNVTLLNPVRQWESEWNVYASGFSPPPGGYGATWSYYLPMYQGYENVNGTVYFAYATYQVSYSAGTTTPYEYDPVYTNISSITLQEIYPSLGTPIEYSASSLYYHFFGMNPVMEFEGQNPTPLGYFNFTDYPSLSAIGTYHSITHRHAAGERPIHGLLSTLGLQYADYYSTVWNGSNPVFLTFHIQYLSGTMPLNQTPQAVRMTRVLSVAAGNPYSAPPYPLLDQYPLLSLAESGQYLGDGMMISYAPSGSDSVVYLFNSSTLALDYSFLIPRVSNSLVMKNTWYYVSSGGDLYIITLPMTMTIRLSVNVFGLPDGVDAHINVFNSSYNSSFTIQVLPGTIPVNITVPSGYVISNISISGPNMGSLNPFLRSYDFAKKFANFTLNISSDPTLNVTFIPDTYNITFSSNLDLGISWLAGHGLQKNVSWTVDVLHGTDPSKVIIDSSYLSSTSENDTNYTLIYSASSQNVTFHLFNGTYRFQYFSGNSLFIPSISGKENLTVSGASQTITADFRSNYPVASFYAPPYIPENYAWVFQSNSSAGNGTSLVSQYWKISGPGGLTYQGYGAQFAVFFNVSGNYSANLTVKASNGLANSTVHTFEVVKPRRIPIIISIKERQGYFTNSSATYVISVTTNESIANVIASIDNSSYMRVQFVSSTSDGNGNYTYEYFANFTPSSYPLGNHFLNFSVYTTTAGFNYTHIEARFGSSGSSQPPGSSRPFNLVTFFGGPANFILVILGIIGVVITVAALKIQRSTDVVIEANGRESVIKTKPVKQGILNRKKGGKKI